ncbi:DOMON-like domain-containing protein [Sphingomonas sp. S2-65]|uniref:DOMON-like domain-containing protein n=1 Tax=Sphingomonas sp. S2-65 TaxID=2903960 RepID=UPI001F4178AC|nr:DOMON-like domain-containing protein [Sphingomonas sp. S2-65]UYY58802.1 DOMON-like domain-containing protein [Sphingomonas sp. S2-65]
MIYSLIPHPGFAPSAVTGVDVEMCMADGACTLTFQVRGAVPALPERRTSERADELWKTTCFELFLRRSGSEGYMEMNFSPSTRWAAYEFASYREGMCDLPLRVDPKIGQIKPEDGVAYAMKVELDPTALLPGVALQANVTAVIEEADGTKSYWALAHPPGKPDFHDPACFVLELPAAKTP